MGWLSPLGAGTPSPGWARKREACYRRCMLNDAAGFVCVLRASTRSPDIGVLLRAFPRLRPEAVWKRGAPDAFGRKQKFNGFNLLLASGTDWKR